MSKHRALLGRVFLVVGLLSLHASFACELIDYRTTAVVLWLISAAALVAWVVNEMFAADERERALRIIEQRHETWHSDPRTVREKFGELVARVKGE